MIIQYSLPPAVLHYNALINCCWPYDSKLKKGTYEQIFLQKNTATMRNNIFACKLFVNFKTSIDGHIKCRLQHDESVQTSWCFSKQLAPWRVEGQCKANPRAADLKQSQIEPCDSTWAIVSLGRSLRLKREKNQDRKGNQTIRNIPRLMLLRKEISSRRKAPRQSNANLPKLQRSYGERAKLRLLKKWEPKKSPSH